MTYNTIRAKLDTLIASGQLFRYCPSFDPDESEKRELLALPSVHNWLYQPDRKKSADYKRRVRAHLTHFVKGKDIDNRDHMKCLSNDVFEFRVMFTKRRENTRIFGAFIIPDVFIATHWKMRNELEPSRGPRWDKAITKALGNFTHLFSDQHTPLRCRPFSDCVTSAAYDHDPGE